MKHLSDEARRKALEVRLAGLSPEEYEKRNKRSLKRAAEAFFAECNGFVSDKCDATWCSFHSFCRFGRKSTKKSDLWWTQPKKTWRYFTRGESMKDKKLERKLRGLYTGPFRSIADLTSSFLSG